MNSNKKFLNNYFIILFSFIPLSILIGPSVSISCIALIILSFLIFFFINKSFFLLKDQTLIILFLLYLYFILNSLFSIDFEIGAKRNFGFLRFIILFIAINYLFLRKENLEKLLKFWMLIFSVVLFDVFYEFYYGENILGFISNNQKRIVSFFKDEQVVGTFLNGFAFILIGFIFINFENKTKTERFLVYFFLVLIFLAMMLTGERSSFIKFIFGLSIFFYLNNKIKLRNKLFFLSSVVIIIFLIFSFLDKVPSKWFPSGPGLTGYKKMSILKHRYYKDFIKKLETKEKRQNLIYFKLYNSGLEVFKKYPFLGAGNKNYRVETCENLTERKQKGNYNEKYICISHPHQIYVEFLSEHGFIGTIILLFVILYLIFKNLKIMLIKRNMIQIGCFSYLLTYFIPILPSGSFFTDFNATFFWLNFSIFYASNLETNIYKKYNTFNL